MTARDTPKENANSREASTKRDLSVTFDALSRPERRAVLLYFHVSGTETADVLELTEFVSNRVEEPDETVLRISLNQHHLPKLADYGFIDYDRRSGVVRCRNTVTGMIELFAE